ncbi:protein CYR61 [Trichonephila clavata]|uniref:Protein CYR61 n=1 Tax=Trichonephila clavata TaxID=2740835 RepID=A0A8X6KT86_TRICU|nr:protein CYR61 [Trichonephila clavata]
MKSIIKRGELDTQMVLKSPTNIVKGWRWLSSLVQTFVSHIADEARSPTYIHADRLNKGSKSSLDHYHTPEAERFARSEIAEQKVHGLQTIFIITRQFIPELIEAKKVFDDRSIRCPERCHCPDAYPQCQDGVPVVMDGCGCCPVCARQQGDVCNTVQVCDVTRKLQCIYVDAFFTTGICRGELLKKIVFS